jgi:hypothetical protein
VKKVGKKDPVGFKVGDKIDTDKIREKFYDENGYPVAEGKDISIFVKRDETTIELPYSIEYKERKYSHRLRILKDLTDSQQNYYSVWIGNKK